MDLDCTCFRIRRLSRQISQLYDEALRPAGLRVTQFSLLSALRNKGPMTVATLARGLGADRTSISRALAAVQAHGWVMVEAGTDKRSKTVSISQAGLETLQNAEPFWETAQQHIANALGGDGQANLDARLDDLFQRIQTA